MSALYLKKEHVLSYFQPCSSIPGSSLWVASQCLALKGRGVVSLDSLTQQLGVERVGLDGSLGVDVGFYSFTCIQSGVAASL